MASYIFTNAIYIELDSELPCHGIRIESTGYINEHAMVPGLQVIPLFESEVV